MMVTYSAPKYPRTLLASGYRFKPFVKIFYGMMLFFNLNILNISVMAPNEQAHFGNDLHDLDVGGRNLILDKLLCGLDQCSRWSLFNRPIREHLRCDLWVKCVPSILFVRYEQWYLFLKLGDVEFSLSFLYIYMRHKQVVIHKVLLPDQNICASKELFTLCDLS